MTMLTAAEACEVNGATQSMILLQRAVTVSRRFPNPAYTPGARGEHEFLHVTFGTVGIKVVWLPELSLLAYSFLSSAVDIMSRESRSSPAPVAGMVFPALQRQSYVKVKWPEDRRLAEYVEKHDDAVIRAVELWKAWEAETDGVLDNWVKELQVQEVMER